MQPRLLPSAARLAVRHSTSAPRTLRRFESSTPYPFTNPSAAASKQPPTAEGAKPQYPFTRADEAPTQVAAPSGRTDRPGPPHDASEVVPRDVNQEGQEGLDWNAMTDSRTSVFSPVPHRVQDGSEEGESLPAAVLSGAPQELQARTVRIYKKSKSAMQSGAWPSHEWRMDWDILPKGHRWENPLMGWQSSGDFMQGTKLNFKSKEEAVRFAEKQGYEWYVQEPQQRKFVPKQYAEQFVHVYGKVKQVRTK